jgi:hypothetical protein
MFILKETILKRSVLVTFLGVRTKPGGAPGNSKRYLDAALDCPGSLITK